MAKRLRVILDSNIWVSLATGKRIASSLENYLLENRIELLSCETLIEEVIDVLSRPKFQKRLNVGRLEELERFMLTETIQYEVSDKIKVCRDPDDDYLLNLAVEAKADYIVTGDKDLLVLHPFQGIEIIEYSELSSILRDSE